jgi:outer membrane protein assembly factor BamB
VNGSAVHGLIGSSAYDGTRLYVSSASPPEGVFALSPEDGHVLWRAAAAEPVYSSPAVGAGVVAVGTGAVFGSTAAGRVQVVTAAGGHLLWSYDAHSAVCSSPAIAGHELCVVDHAGRLRCFR